MVVMKLENAYKVMKQIIHYDRIKPELDHITHTRYKFKPTLSKITDIIGCDRHSFYVISPELLSNNPIMFSFGIGDDVEAEKQAIERYNFNVYAFDPTPKTSEWIKDNKPNKFTFDNIALTDYDGEATFYFPENNNYISGSIEKNNVGWQNLSDQATIVKCNKLSTIMKNLGIIKIDYLKLCIEGCEYKVIDNIISEKLDISQIAIAFVGRALKTNFTKDKKLYNLLIKNGYECLKYQNDRKITFIKKDS